MRLSMHYPCHTRTCLRKRLLSLSLGLAEICGGVCHGRRYISAIRRSSATLKTPRMETAPKSDCSDLLSFFLTQNWVAARWSPLRHHQMVLKKKCLSGRVSHYRPVYGAWRVSTLHIFRPS